jgi:predicted nucleic acid-binding Zn ribbon protein
MSYRRTGDGSMKEALQAWLRELRIEQKVSETRLVAQWDRLMGPAIANRTLEVKIRDGVLYVTLNSAALRQELLQSREKIIQLLNREAGAEIIKEVVLR